MAVVLGVDVGEKKIGLALGRSADGWAFTRPALLVATWDQVWPALKDIIAAESVDLVVVGLPLDHDGQAGLQASRVRDFITQLRQQVTVPIVERDERNTTAAVNKEQAGQKLTRGQEDSLAAQLLVESYLEELKQ